MHDAEQQRRGPESPERAGYALARTFGYVARHSAHIRRNRSVVPAAPPPSAVRAHRAPLTLWRWFARTVEERARKQEHTRSALLLEDRDRQRDSDLRHREVRARDDARRRPAEAR